MGKVSALAALLDCTDEWIAKLRAFAGIEGNVILDEDAAVAKIEELAKTPPKTEMSDPKELQLYCDEQIAQADTEQERTAAIALRSALSDRLTSALSATT